MDFTEIKTARGFETPESSYVLALTTVTLAYCSDEHANTEKCVVQAISVAYHQRYCVIARLQQRYLRFR